MFFPPLNQGIFPPFLGKESEGNFKNQFYFYLFLTEHAEIAEYNFFFSEHFVSPVRDIVCAGGDKPRPNELMLSKQAGINPAPTRWVGIRM